MREVTQYLSHRGNLVRRILTYAIAAIVAVTLLILVTTLPAFAAGSASWSGDNISYKDVTYGQKTANGATPPSLARQQTYYLNTAAPDPITGAGTASIIYFPTNANSRSATSAKYVVYKLDGSGQYGAKITGPTDIAIIAKNVSATAGQAGWAGTAIEYEGRSLEGDGSSPFIADGTTAPVLTKGSQYYQVGGTPDIGGNGILYVISFPASATPEQETSALYSTFKIDGSGNIGAQIGSAKTITIVPSGVANSGTAGAGSSCSVEGIGWIVCPVSTFLAWGMDNIFTMLKGFLEVQPLSTDSNSSLYQAWNVVRSIANIAFVIAFLIIIFSQLTNLGVTNYGLKKLIPRLVVAAILVNISYIICTVAVDISNVLGSSVQNVLISIRDSTAGPNTNSIGSWESVTGFILSAGTATGAATVAIGGIVIASGASLGAALILLLPALLGLILAVLVALLVLATRQALIVILVILAPLAFVAYLLPNTEKLFEKWRSLFMTMLVFFPLFALIFGGSQLAGFLIIQTARDINVILLAMFVQVAPLVLTPLLIRFSGGIVGRVAGFVNDPKKGLIDRTRNWSKQTSELLAARNMARRDPIRSRQVFRRYASGADQFRRTQEARLAAYKETSEARWTQSRPYSNAQQDLLFAQDEKTEGTESANLRYETSKTQYGRTQNVDLRVREVKLRSENAKAQSDLQWDSSPSANVVEQRLRSRVLKDQIATVHTTHDAEYEEYKYGRMGHFPATAAVSAMRGQAQADTRLIALNAMRSESAKRAVIEQFTDALKNNDSMQLYAGGAQGAQGAERALAAAISAASRAGEESVANAMTILSNANYDDATITNIALRNTAGTNILLTDDLVLAATKRIASGGNMVEMIRLMEEVDLDSHPDNQDLRQVFSDTMMANPNKPKFFGAGVAARAKQGNVATSGSERSHSWIVEAINANKYGSAEVLTTQDRDALETVFNAIDSPTSRLGMSRAALARIKSEIVLAQTDHRWSGRIAERQEVLQKIHDAI
jgi:hypothetical protein